MSGFIVWIGGLPRGVKEVEIEEFLIQYAVGHGKLRDVQVRSSPRDVFAFVTFAVEKDAKEAIRDLSNKEFLESNCFIKMELSDKGGGAPARGGGGKGAKSPRGKGGKSRPVSRSRRRSNSRRSGRGRSRSRSRSRRSRSRSRGGQSEEARDRPLTIWLGGLPKGCNDEEVSDFCRGYGKINVIRIRSSDKDVFAFVTFADGIRAKDCVKELDQKEWPASGTQDKGHVIQVRESATKRPAKDRSRYDKSPPTHLSKVDGKKRYKVELKQLPSSVSWFKLKDLAREVGDSVCFANVFVKSGVTCGVVEFMNIDDALSFCQDVDRGRIEGWTDKVEVAKAWD